MLEEMTRCETLESQPFRPLVAAEGHVGKPCFRSEGLWTSEASEGGAAPLGATEGAQGAGQPQRLQRQREALWEPGAHAEQVRGAAEVPHGARRAAHAAQRQPIGDAKVAAGASQSSSCRAGDRRKGLLGFKPLSLLDFLPS